MSANTFYRYVTPPCVDAYVALGWLDLGPSPGHHGQWSNTLVYKGDCDEPPEPRGDIVPKRETVSGMQSDGEAERAEK